MRGTCATWLLLGLGEMGCGFSPSAAALSDGQAIVDTAMPDTPLPPPVARWIVAGVTTTTPGIVVHPFAGVFGTPCAKQTSPSYAYRTLLTRNDSTYVYGVESEFWGFGLGCASVDSTMVAGGGPRPIQRIVLDSTTGVGFFTADGALAIGVYRFTTASDGKPTIGGSANAPSAAGALVFDSAHAALYMAGTSAVYQYTLVGTQLTFPSPGSNVAAPMCTAPVDLIVSGDSILGFCSDVPGIRHYVRSPFAYDKTINGLGATTQVVALPNDMAVAATSSPSSLVVLTLNNGAPTLSSPVALSSSVTAMAVSEDGLVLVTAQQKDASNAEITAWSVSGTTLTKLATEPQAGTITALAITKPGT